SANPGAVAPVSRVGRAGPTVSDACGCHYGRIRPRKPRTEEDGEEQTAQERRRRQGKGGEAMSEPMIRCPVCNGTTPASWRHGFGAEQVYVCRECGESIRAELVESRPAGGR